MIRSILILVYIAAVLLVSGLAQAADSETVARYAQVQEVKFDQNNYMLHVRGAFLTSCQTAPKPELVQTVQTEDEEVVYVGVRVEQTPGMVCAQVVNGQYDLVFDIRTLNLAPHKDLVLKFKNGISNASAPLMARIDHEAFGLQFAAVEVVGRLIEMPQVGFDRDAAYAVVGEDGKVVHLQSLVDISGYVNNRVRIAGIPLGHAVTPALDVTDLSFGKKDGEKPEKVFATEISLTPLQ